MIREGREGGYLSVTDFRKNTYHSSFYKNTIKNYIYSFPWPFLCIIINVNIMKMGGIYTRNRLVYDSTYKNLIVFNRILNNCIDDKTRNWSFATTIVYRPYIIYEIWFIIKGDFFKNKKRYFKPNKQLKDLINDKTNDN